MAKRKNEQLVIGRLALPHFIEILINAPNVCMKSYDIKRDLYLQVHKTSKFSKGII